MSIKLQLPKLTDLRPRITVVGVGGAGGNALNNMIASGLEGVEFVAANTDAQALAMTGAEHRIQLGVTLTEGLGAGSKPEIGQAAAEEAVDEIRQQLSGSHMCFIAAGMGGGTGTGAAAVIARVAKGLGILTVGVVTKPFQFEGARRMRMAESGIVELRKHVDTLIVIPNQNLFRIATERTTFADAFQLADQVLHSGVACIVDLIVREGLINLDFADVRTVMANMGNAMMGTGEGSGERRAVQAAEAAIHNPLIDDISLKGAKGLLLSVTGGRDLTLYEVDEAASRVRQEVDPEANIIVGATFDDTLVDKIRVSIVASGIVRAGEIPAALDVAQTFAQPAPPSAAQTTADESLRQRLAQALQSDVDSPPNVIAHAPSLVALRALRERALRDDAPLDLAEDIAPDAGQAMWKGPGDVSIVEDMPQLSQAAMQRLQGTDAPGGIYAQPMPAPPTLAPASPPHPSQYNAGSTPFRPAPPTDVRATDVRAVEARPAPRRMPEVGDFPAVGQRVYHANVHAQDNGAGMAEPPASPPAASASPSQQSGERRPRFFERWTSSLQRRLGESPTATPAHDSAHGPSAAAPAGPPAGQGAAPSNHGHSTHEPPRQGAGWQAGPAGTPGRIDPSRIQQHAENERISKSLKK